MGDRTIGGKGMTKEPIEDIIKELDKPELPPLYYKAKKLEVVSGQLFWETGYFMYYGHADGAWHPECFVPPQTKMMLFKENEKAPGLGSCNHPIVWRYVCKAK